MKRLVKGFAALAVVAAVSAAPAHAQGVTFSLGGGLTMPLGDYGDATSTGFNGQVGVGFQPANLPIGFEVDGHFILNSGNEDLVGDLDINSRILAGTVNAVYKFKTAETSQFKPYIIAGLGMYNGKATGDDVPDGVEGETDFGINAGAGFDVAVSSLALFVEGRFHNVFSDPSNTNLVNINVGVRLGGGAR